MEGYKERYGAWAGFPSGKKPDFTRCCESVWPNERGAVSHQCRRKKGFGPNGNYCKQHDPEAVAARQKKAYDKYADELSKLRFQWSGRKFYDTLKAIADGHNDARGLAQDALRTFHDGDKK